MCVAHVGSDMTNLVFIRDLFGRGVENGWEGTKVTVGKPGKRKLCISPPLKIMLDRAE